MVWSREGEPGSVLGGINIALLYLRWDGGVGLVAQKGKRTLRDLSNKWGAERQEDPGAILADECWDSESQGTPCWSKVGGWRGSWGGDRRGSLTPPTTGTSSVGGRVQEGPPDAPSPYRQDIKEKYQQ